MKSDNICVPSTVVNETTWVVSLVAHKKEHVNHCACAVTALNHHEAYGKAMSLARLVYPRDDGWIGHSADVRPLETSTITDVSKARIVPT